ncbi:MAG: hypothetical protein ACTH4Y_08380 [Microbacterium gubbeenense]|uniref:hypothetical protein n=1 Tax=Microbacterium gubbeenense TaxID=159896 RepID=UPI003F9C04DE
MHKRSRALIEYGQMCGFVLEDELDSNSHYVMKHPNGERVGVAGTPGATRADMNKQAEMRRKSGVNPQRPNAARYKHEKRRGFSMDAALRGPRGVGTYSTGDVTPIPPAVATVLDRLERRQAELAVEVEEKGYPYLIQEYRLICQKIRTLKEIHRVN